MTALYWIAGLAPLVAFAFGWAVGFGQAGKASAKQIGELENDAEQRKLEIKALRHQVVALSAADMPDDEFNSLLDDLAEGAEPRHRVLIADG